MMLIGGALYAIVEDWGSVLFRSISFHIVSALAGFVLIFLAFRAAATGGRELAKGRVGDIPRLETNQLVTSGIFSCMRHPMLFGLTLLPMGWALLLGSPTFILYLAPAEMLFIVMMVLVFEEMEIQRKFGVAYEKYRQQVPMVSFRPHCLKQLLGFGKGV